jgi:YbbR domain-containing protein
MLERLLTNWPLKLLSLFMALAIWLAVMGQSWVVQDFRVPLDIRMPPDRTLSAAPPTAVTVRLRGPESLFRKLDPLRLVVRPDLSEAPTGAIEVLLSDSDIDGVLGGMQVAFIDPSRLTLTLEELLRRHLPVEAHILGEPPRGYALYDAAVQPDTVTVEGPESQVRPLERVRTSPVRIDGHTTSFTLRVAAVPEGTVRVVDAMPLVAHVTIDTAPVERVFDAVRVGTPGNATAEVVPQAIRVAVRGPAALVDRLDASQVRAVAEPLDPAAAIESVPVRIDLSGIAPADLPRLSVTLVGPTHVTVRREAARS